MVFKPLGDDSDSGAKLEKDTGQKKTVRATRVAQAVKRKVRRVTRATVLAAVWPKRSFLDHQRLGERARLHRATGKLVK